MKGMLRTGGTAGMGGQDHKMIVEKEAQNRTTVHDNEHKKSGHFLNVMMEVRGNCRNQDDV